VGWEGQRSGREGDNISRPANRRPAMGGQCTCTDLHTDRSVHTESHTQRADSELPSRMKPYPPFSGVNLSEAICDAQSAGDSLK